jgi:hypothetical protein
VPDFQELFEESGYKPVVWNGTLVQIMDNWNVVGGEEFLLRFISATAVRPQGLSLGLRGGAELSIDDQIVSGVRRSALLWYHLYKDLEVVICVPNKIEPSPTQLKIINAWENSYCGVEEGTAGGAMIVTEKRVFEGVQRLYKCNDFDPDDDFDDLVFTVTRVK